MRAQAPHPCDHRDHVSTVCSRASSPRPSLWCTRPSPAAVSSVVCVWVSQVEDNEGGSGTSHTFNYTPGGDPERPKNFQAFFCSLRKLQNECLRPGPNCSLSVSRSGTNNIKCFRSYICFHSFFTKILGSRNYWPNLTKEKAETHRTQATHQVPRLRLECHFSPVTDSGQVATSF